MSSGVPEGYMIAESSGNKFVILEHFVIYGSKPADKVSGWQVIQGNFATYDLAMQYLDDLIYVNRTRTGDAIS